jgi:hypothetical protein
MQCYVLFSFILVASIFPDSAASGAIAAHTPVDLVSTRSAVDSRQSVSQDTFASSLEEAPPLVPKQGACLHMSQTCVPQPVPPQVVVSTRGNAFQK